MSITEQIKKFKDAEEKAQQALKFEESLPKSESREKLRQALIQVRLHTLKLRTLEQMGVCIARASSYVREASEEQFANGTELLNELRTISNQTT